MAQTIEIAELLCHRQLAAYFRKLGLVEHRIVPIILPQQGVQKDFLPILRLLYSFSKRIQSSGLVPVDKATPDSERRFVESIAHRLLDPTPDALRILPTCVLVATGIYVHVFQVRPHP